MASISVNTFTFMYQEGDVARLKGSGKVRYDLDIPARKAFRAGRRIQHETDLPWMAKRTPLPRKMVIAMLQACRKFNEENPNFKQRKWRPDFG